MLKSNLVQSRYTTHVYLRYCCQIINKESELSGKITFYWSCHCTLDTPPLYQLTLKFQL